MLLGLRLSHGSMPPWRRAAKANRQQTKRFKMNERDRNIKMIITHLQGIAALRDLAEMNEDNTAKVNQLLDLQTELLQDATDLLQNEMRGYTDRVPATGMAAWRYA